MNLYPLKFNPIHKPKIWGSEEWLIAALGDNDTIAQNGYLQDNSLSELLEVYMSDLVGDEVFEEHNLNFPLIIKTIDAKHDLSVQVHPDDKFAEQYDGSFGKNEMWYVTHAEPNTKIILGHKHGVSTTDIEKAIAENDEDKLLSLLNVEDAKQGDVFFIPAGTIHALGGGITVVEVQQSSDITFRLYDYNRKDAEGNSRELHVKQALQMIDSGDTKFYKIATDDAESNKVKNLLTNEPFTVNLLPLNRLVMRDYATLNSMVLFICVEGELKVSTADGELMLSKHEACLMPATVEEVSLSPKQNARLLEIYL